VNKPRITMGKETHKLRTTQSITSWVMNTVSEISFLSPFVFFYSPTLSTALSPNGVGETTIFSSFPPLHRTNNNNPL